MFEVTITIVEANAMALSDTSFAPTALAVAQYLEAERSAFSVNLPMDTESFKALARIRINLGMEIWQTPEDAYAWLKLQGHFEA